MEFIGRTRVFITVAEQGSFAAAARELGMTPPAISKHIQKLEEHLGAKLFNRTTRRVSLTSVGARYYERARQALALLDEAHTMIAEESATPSGALKINVPSSFGQRYLVQPLAAFAKKYPDVRLSVSFNDDMVDIIEDGYDMIVRIGALEDSSLIMRKLADCPIFACASPEYIANNGTPEHPDDLAQHKMIRYNRHGKGNRWRWQNTDGLVGQTELPTGLDSDTASMMTEAALAGVGIATLPIFSAAPLLESGKLVRVLPEYSTYPTREIVMLYPSRELLPQKTKLLLDWLSKACLALPWCSEFSAS